MKKSAIATWKDWFRRIPFSVLLIIFLSGLLAISGIGERIFWADEVHLVNLGRSILIHGIPVVDDVVKQREVVYEFEDSTGISYSPTVPYAVNINGNELYSLHPWLVSYIAAVPIAIFGPFAQGWTRLPFVLIGILGILVTFLLANRLVNERTGIIASLLTGFSVVFLLALRNVNYYGLVLFAVPFSVLGFMRLLKNEQHAGAHFTIAASIVFHSQWLTFLGMMLGLYGYILFVERIKWQRFVLPTLGIILLTLPWFILTKQYAKVTVLNGISSTLLFGMIGIYQVLIWLIPLVILVCIPFLIKKEKGLWLLLFVVAGTIFINSLNSYTGAPLRYFYGVLPICSILSGAVLEKVMNKSKITAAVLISLLLLTNAISVVPLLPLKSIALHLSESDIRDTSKEERAQFIEKTLQLRFLFVEYIQEMFVPVRSVTRGILDVLEKEDGGITVCTSCKVGAQYGNLVGNMFVGAGDPAALAYYARLNVSTYANNYKTRTFDWIVLTPDDERNKEMFERGFTKVASVDLSAARWGDTADPTHHLFATTPDAGAIVYHTKS